MLIFISIVNIKIEFITFSHSDIQLYSIITQVILVLFQLIRPVKMKTEPSLLTYECSTYLF